MKFVFSYLFIMPQIYQGRVIKRTVTYGVNDRHTGQRARYSEPVLKYVILILVGLLKASRYVTSIKVTQPFIPPR